MNDFSASQRRSPWGLMAFALVLSVLGLVLVGHVPTPVRGSAVSAPSPAAPTGPSSSSTRSPTSVASALAGVPVLGDGPAGDAAVQHLLDRVSAPNLPRAVERHLVQLGVSVWEADVTGRGRERWPQYFKAAGAAGGGRSAYREVRVQAGIARRVAGGRVEVRLVWSATDPSGDRRDGRLARLVFRSIPHHPSRWEPVV